jgi:hypothetical protein
LTRWTSARISTSYWAIICFSASSRTVLMAASFYFVYSMSQCRLIIPGGNTGCKGENSRTGE